MLATPLRPYRGHMTLPPEHRDLDIGNNRQGDREFYQLMPGMSPHPALAPYHVRGPQTAGAPAGQVGAANPSGGREANEQQEEGRSKPARLGPPMGFCGAGHPEHGCRACRWEAGPGCAAAESAVPEAALPSACPRPAPKLLDSNQPTRPHSIFSRPRDEGRLAH